MEIEATPLRQNRSSQPVESFERLDLGEMDGAVHLIGIGGIGMSALAEILLSKGRTVSGSDRQASTITKRLAARGAKIVIGHQASNIGSAAAVVVSTAIPEDNPELAAARATGVPIVHRSQLLSCLAAGKKLIAITGTHGKTTTTGMVYQILCRCGLDPSLVLGGILPGLGGNARAGRGEHFVAEVDESDRTHTAMRSYIGVITNLEPDHMENYPGGLKQLKESMVSFARTAQQAVILCQDDPGARSVGEAISTRVITYGLQSGSPDYGMESLGGNRMRMFVEGRDQGEFTLPIPGEHNKLNALAALALAHELCVPDDQAKEALESFPGIDRRFQILGTASGITVVDDYAHHPTEIEATLKAARSYLEGGSGRQVRATRVVAVFQPHQPRRLRDLWQGFLAAFNLADLLIVTDIYIARGGALPGVTSEAFVKAIDHPQAIWLPGEVSTLPGKIKSLIREGDLVLTIGAGDITRVGSELLEALKHG